MRFFKMDNSNKRLFEVVIDDLDEVLSQAVDKHEREEAFSNDGLDEIFSQSLDMFEEVNNMFEFGGPSLVMAHPSDALQGYKRETEEQLLKVSKIVQGQKEKESTVKGNSNSALTSALEIPSSSGTLVLNICGGKMFVKEFYELK